MSARRSVAVRIRGKEFRIRSDEDADELQRIAAYVDATMRKVETRTGTIDSLDVAMLTSLNLARELVTQRAQATSLPEARLRELVDLAESGLELDAS